MLPKTSQLLDEYYHKNENKKEKMSVYQFFKYINFLGVTENNCIPMFYGSPKNDTSKISIIEEFKKKGYITGGSANQCHRELFLLYRATKYQFRGFDHENYALFCDPNYNPPNNKNQGEIGIYSRKRRCLYGKDTFEYVFEYGKKFLEAYKNERKFLRVAFIDPHETTIAVVKYMDDAISDFLNYVIENYSNSAIFIMSDHGANFQSKDFNFLAGNDFRIERELGTFFFLIPDNIENDFYSLEYNEQILITPYDIHDTFCDILLSDDKEYSKKGKSLFNKIDGMERNCSYYNREFEKQSEERCPCVNFKN